MIPYERLLVLWAEPERHRRYVIGELWREAGPSYAFGYTDLEVAKRVGFSLLPEFPTARGLTSPYRSKELFSTFAQRIPSPGRPDRQQILKSWGAEGSDSFEMLALSGGILATDRLELSEYRPLEDDLQRPLFFRVSGEKYFPGGSSLRDGDPVEFLREKSNEVDSYATCILVTGGEKVGWVPRQYSELIARNIDSGQPLKAVAVHRLILPADRDRWVVSVARRP